jgi:Protein of unknown function (DUF2938)
MNWAAWGLAGVVATLVMDVASGVVRSTGLTHGAPPQLLGRFFLSVFRGHFTALDPSIPLGLPVSWGLILAVHYAIGTALAVLCGLAVGRFSESPPQWWLYVLYGLGTTVLPAFWMFPAMGFGRLGLRAPNELHLLRTALVNHLFFGLGLALATTIIGPRLRRGAAGRNPG